MLARTTQCRHRSPPYPLKHFRRLSLQPRMRGGTRVASQVATDRSRTPGTQVEKRRWPGFPSKMTRTRSGSKRTPPLRLHAARASCSFPFPFPNVAVRRAGCARPKQRHPSPLVCQRAGMLTLDRDHFPKTRPSANGQSVALSLQNLAIGRRAVSGFWTFQAGKNGKRDGPVLASAGFDREALRLTDPRSNTPPASSSPP